MTGAISQTIGGVFLLAGSFFLLVGAVGLLRMPDLFTRIHAASVGETLGGSLLIIGMMFHSGFSLVTFKLLVLLGVIFFFGPVATHALARAARYAGVEPELSKAVPEQIQSAAPAPDATPKTKKKPRRKQANARRKPVKKKGTK